MGEPLRKLLYVDDEESNLVVFEAAFDDVFEVLTAANAEEALALLESEIVPVVVADQRMPEMTGIEMFRILRQRDPQIQRVILSGYTDSDDLIDAINDGQIFQFVRKPWNREELLGVLLRAFDAHELSLRNSFLQEKLVLSDRCAMLGRSAATIAHEMGNQMGVLPLIEMIEDEYPADEQLSELAGLARVTHDRLQQLIGEIRSFVRCESVDGSPTPTLLSAILTELTTFFKYGKLVPHDLLSVLIREDAVVVVDRFKLQQVLINLIRNATDAMEGRPDGRIELTASREDMTAIIEVTDNGIGIPPRMLPRIWEPFFTTKGKSGTGLGLDVVRNIIQSQHGRVTCESIPGQGTTFRIELPVSIVDVASEPSSEPIVAVT